MILHINNSEYDYPRLGQGLQDDGRACGALCGLSRNPEERPMDCQHFPDLQKTTQALI